MNVRKFSAATSRDAWRQVREALGPDAVILSNRTINGTIEILALAPEDMSALGEPVIEKPVVSESTLAAFGAARETAQPGKPAIDHRNGDEPYVPARLEQALGRVAHLRAREIFEAIKADLLDFAPPSDDVSLVVIKRA